jgi:hypothetical protein
MTHPTTDNPQSGPIELSDEELGWVAGGVGINPGGPPPGEGGATVIGRPPTLIITPKGRTIEPGTGPVIFPCAC